VAQENFSGVELYLEGYLNGTLKDWGYSSVKERVEIGHRKHFKHNHWIVRKQKSGRTCMFKKIQVVYMICCYMSLEELRKFSLIKWIEVIMKGLACHLYKVHLKNLKPVSNMIRYIF